MLFRYRIFARVESGNSCEAKNLYPQQSDSLHPTFKTYRKAFVELRKMYRQFFRNFQYKSGNLTLRKKY